MVLFLIVEKECRTNLKISFATDSRINSIQKPGFSEISKKKKRAIQKRIVRFSFQFLKTNF